MNLNLTGKRALVCGGSKGIGKAIASCLAQEGAEVVIVARKESELKEAVDELKGEAHGYFVADLGDKSSVDSICEMVQKRGFDIVINNAGGPPPGPVASAKLEEFQQAIEMHLYASHRIMQAVLPGMKERSYGRFINIISTSVKIPIPGLGVSNTTRGAMASWSKTLASELAPHGITVNNILPGAVETTRLEAIFKNQSEKSGISMDEAAEDMRAGIPAGRFGQPEELGYLATFLASDKAAYITGVSIQVDGGRTGSL